MATNFPTSLDNLTNPAGSDPVNDPSHATQHANINDAIEVLEEKVGINNSAVTTSLDYRVKQLETNPTYTNEEARDAIALALRASGGITVSSDDIANTITVSTDSTIATKTYVDTAVSNLGSTAASTYVPVSEVGQADGIATLDATGQVPFSQLGNLVASAPATLDTLNELATALGNDANFATTTATSIGNKVSKAGGDIIEPSSASVTGLTIKGAVSQTANLQQWLNSSGDLLGRFHPTAGLLIPGVANTGGGAAPFMVFDSTNFSLYTNTASNKGLVIRGAASQTANLMEFQNSSGTALTYFNSSGGLTATEGVISTAYSGGKMTTGTLGYFNATTFNAAVSPIVVRGAASQTANLQEWQNSSGTITARVGNGGQIVSSGVGVFGAQSNASNAQLAVIANSLVYPTFVAKAIASQTANLTEWQDSTGTVNASMTSLGRLNLGGAGLGSYSLTIRATDAIILYSPDNTSAIKSNTAYTRGNTGGTPMYLGSIGDTANGVAAITTTSGAGSTSITSFGVNGNIVTNLQSASAIGLIVKGTASQTANLTEWQDSAGTVLVSVQANGYIQGSYINLTSGGGILSSSSNQLYANSGSWLIVAPGPTKNGLIIKGAASQTANLQEWQGSTGTAVAKVSSNGAISSISGGFFGTASGPIDAGNYLAVRPWAANHIPFTVKGFAAQTGDLTRWLNDAGAVLAKVDSTGAMFTTTPADSTNTTQVATTAYVKSNINNLINAAPGTLDTLGEIATALAASDSAAAALVTSVNLKAPLASPDLTGTPTAPTAVAGTNTTQLATTAFVKTELSTSIQPGALYQTSAPSSPAVGQIWIDSDEDVTTFDPNIIRRKAITATAGQTVFTADLPFIDGFEQIFMNGLLLVKTTDYATSGGNTVTLTSAAAVSDVIEIVSVTGANSVDTYTQAEVNALLAANTSVAPLSISANTTLVAKKRYFVTSASALTLTLPASPALNDEIQIVDASGSASTYNITVARNANKINGDTVNLIIDTNGGWVTLLYTGSTYGWKVG